MGSAKTKRPGQRRKRIEDVVAYAISHRIRVHILWVLNEGTYTNAQIAKIIGEPANNVANHVRELLDAGSIELAKSELKGNISQHYYRAVEIPFYSREDAEAMTHEQRQVTAGLVVQTALAEIMAALWSGALADPKAFVAFDSRTLDQQGRDDLEEAEMNYLERVQELEVESTNRRAESGEEGQSMVVTVFGYERAKRPPRFPTS
ncbi:MAG TPA: winged helix-turn-helix domain-containing protein [Solirubrobacterales bacterium]|nr:winged helix-turn-helix domain-containing protein [Solirubrobacterales bacterium]